MPNTPRQDDLERESNRLNEGLKSCRSVVNNYRAMLSGEQPKADNDESDAGDSAMSDYVSTTGETSGAYQSDSDLN